MTSALKRYQETDTGLVKKTYINVIKKIKCVLERPSLTYIKSMLHAAVSRNLDNF